MREVNDAWAVLRNPAARAAYDSQLAAASPALAGRSAGGGAGAGGVADRSAASTPPAAAPYERVEPEVADVEPVRPAAAPAATRGWFRQFLPVLVILGTLVVVLVATAYASTRPKDVSVQTKERFAAGSCVIVTFDAAGEKVADEVPCSGRTSGRVVAKVDFPRPCPLGTVAVPFPADKVSLCLSPTSP